MLAKTATLSLFIVAIVLCCFASELVPVSVERPPVEIAGGYSLGRSTLGGLKLYGKEYKCHDDPNATCYPTVVDQSVVRIGWDDNFILIERHPLDTVIFATPDATNPSWFIIVLSSSKIYDNLSHEKFAELIKTLEIPEIEMQDAMDVYN